MGKLIESHAFDPLMHTHLCANCGCPRHEHSKVVVSEDELDSLRTELAAARRDLVEKKTEVRDLLDGLTAARRECEELRAELDRLATLRPMSEWHEDCGDVLWWRVPVCEPPFYQGSPLDTDWCDVEADVTHWTPIPNPKVPNAD
jgi:hypothetical protein